MASKKQKKQAKKAQQAAQLARIKAASNSASSSIKQNKSDKQSKLSGTMIGALAAALLITLFAFLPSFDNQYVNWDDDKNFYENEEVITINSDNFWKNTREIFTGDVIGNYNPLTIFSFALEERFVSQESRPFVRHLNNFLLHAGCVIFIFLIGARLGLGLWGATFIALLFAVHPMRVESVAWVTERKDVLFGFFYLGAFYYYLRGKQEGFGTKDWLLITLFFILSLFSKIQAVFLPVSMVLLDYYLSKDAKLTVTSILTKVPFFIGSLIIGIVNILKLKAYGTVGEQEYEGISRLFIGSYSLVIYYIKALIPFRLSPLYPYPSSLDWTFYVSIISFVGTAAYLILAYRKKWRVGFFGVAFFMANVFMLLQILGAGQGFLADRFTYVAYFGLFFIMAYYLNKAINDKPSLKLPLLGVAGLMIATYSLMTYNQNKIWKNSGTLWTHVLKYYENSTLPWGNRANYYRDTGKTSLALSDYNKVISLDPSQHRPYNSRARLYFNFNNRDSLMKALDNYNKAINLQPGNVEYRVNRGATYAKLGDGQRALQNLNEAEQIDPSFANIYLNRSVIYNQDGQRELAIKDIDKYLSIKPNFPDLWYEKANLHNSLQQDTQGFEAISKAIKMNNTKGIYYFERAKSNFMLGKQDLAISDLNTAAGLGYKGDPKIINQIKAGR